MERWGGHGPLASDTISNETETGKRWGICSFRVCEWLPFLALSDHSNPSILGSFQRVGREGSGGAEPRSRAGYVGLPLLETASVLWSRAMCGSVLATVVFSRAWWA